MDECMAVICDPLEAWAVGLIFIGAVCLLIPFFDRLTRNRK